MYAAYPMSPIVTSDFLLGEACPPKEGSLCFGDVTRPPVFWTWPFSTLANHFTWQTEHLIF